MSTTNFNKFCLVQNFGTPQAKTWGEIKELMQSTQVIKTCNAIAALDQQASDYQSKKTKLKQKLPAINVHACRFEGNKRTIENAWWNGMVCLEYDHLTQAEVNAFRDTEPPTPYIKLAGKSCSGLGVWFLIEVPNSDYSQMEQTLRSVHEAYCQQILSRTGLDIREKADIALDLARIRFLPAYEYIWWDVIEDFHSEEEQAAGYMNMYGNVIQFCAELDGNIPEGQRHTAYKEYVVKLKQLTDNKSIMLKHIPSLGLPESERVAMINWSECKISTKPVANNP